MLKKLNLVFTRKVIALAVFFFALSFQVFSQDAKIWYFGQFAGVSFNTNQPTALGNGAMYAEEGCATITDSLGNLLLYTDGITVYNRLHSSMLNGTGLASHPSSSQGALIVPLPGSATIFYIFTTEVQPLGKFHYTIVDLSLNGGLGD